MRLVHIAAGTLLVGGSFFAPHVRRAIRSASTVEELRAWLDLARRASRTTPLIAMTVLATGVYLGSAGWWTQSWFFLSLAVWLVNSLLAVLVVQRAATTLARAAGQTGGGPVNDELERLRSAPDWDRAEEIMRACDLAMIYIMVLKPSLIESSVVLVGLVIAFLGIQAVRVRRPPRAAAHAA
jgi:uncharacterized membrane protein